MNIFEAQFHGNEILELKTAEMIGDKRLFLAEVLENPVRGLTRSAGSQTENTFSSSSAAWNDAACFGRTIAALIVHAGSAVQADVAVGGANSRTCLSFRDMKG